jgi:NAD(P)-dependent dehydrogenase (short-subunit alcohol dehydrogenase family)
MIPCGWRLEKGKWQEESSFFGKKEAKKLYSFGGGLSTGRRQVPKVFCFFFSKKKTLPSFPLPGFPRSTPAMFDLTGQCALVTGAGSHGIGRAIALALAQAGADVAVHHHSQPETAGALAAEIVGMGRRSTAIDADFSAPPAAREAVMAAHDAFGRLDILVCTAAVLHRAPALETTDADWQLVQTINLQSTFAAAQQAALLMRPWRHGRIVLVSSVNQFTPNVGLVAYAASKGGMAMAAKVMALELAGEGITVNLIAPGTIETDFNRAALADPAWRAGKEALIPMGRIGQPQDVAAAAVFLAGPGAAYITGTTITVDGGLEVRP